MTSLVLTRGECSSISEDEAVHQFDLLFDEYLDVTRATQSKVVEEKLPDDEDQWEGQVQGKAYEHDEVCADSCVDPEQKENMQQIAKELAKLGDKYSEQYGDVKASSVLTSLFTSTNKLEYQTFVNALESLGRHDRSAAGFVAMMHLTGKVVNNVGDACHRASNYFRRYISDNYVPALANAGGVEQFVGQSQQTNAGTS